MENTITVNFRNLTEEEKKQIISLAKKSTDRVKLSEIENGATFRIGDISFIKLSDKDGAVTAISKDNLGTSIFGKSTNFAKSKVLNWMCNNVLPKLACEIGEENILNVEIDLTTLDGVKTFGKYTSKIGLLTMDSYREHTEILDKYKLDEWWWLATSWSANPHNDSSSVLCVSPSGCLDYYFYDYGSGVRPFLRFSSSIFVSCDE